MLTELVLWFVGSVSDQYLFFTACIVQLCQLSVEGQLAYPVGQTVESFSENLDGSIILTYQAINYDKYLRYSK